MRLFTGIDLSQDVIRSLEGLLDQLRPTARITWSPIANLHITTRFIGEWPEDRLADLRTAVGGLPGHPPFPIPVRYVVFFPTPHPPRFFGAGGKPPPDLSF